MKMLRIMHITPLGAKAHSNRKEASMDRRIRVLIGKPGLDGHDRGAKYIARALRDAGMEVIYTGIRQTPLAIADAAIQEDVDFVGLSLLSGAHNHLFPEVARILREKGAEDIVLFGGGVIPEEDIPGLQQAGFKAIFTPGAPASAVVSFIENEQKNRS
jgi:methylmalonyl-CoA mutase C-terminal domain/subunit